MHGNADESSKNDITEALECLTAKIVCSIGDNGAAIHAGTGLVRWKPAFGLKEDAPYFVLHRPSNAPIIRCTTCICVPDLRSV